MLNLECTKLVEVLNGQNVVVSVEQVIRSQFIEEFAEQLIENLQDVSKGVLQSLVRLSLYTKENGETAYSESRYVFMVSDLGNFHKIEMYRK